MQGRRVVYTDEMIQKADSKKDEYAKGDSRSTFAWHVREAVGIYLKIPKERRHNDAD